MTSKPMIENSERGITVNKTLAWTMVVGLLGGGFFIGGELVGTNTIMQEMKQSAEASRNEMRQVTSSFDARIRTLETARAGDAADNASTRRELSDLRTEFRALRSDVQMLLTELRQERARQ